MERLSLSQPYNAIEFAIHAVRYMPLRAVVPKKRVLDIACGEGLGSSLLSRWGASSVTGVDLSEAAVASAIEATRMLKGKTDIVCADACDFLERSKTVYDVIASVETIEHLADPKRFLTLCKLKLAPKGTLLVSCPNDRFYYGAGQTMNPFHHFSYGFDEFRALAEEILGPGSWALGSLLSGFGLVPTAETDTTADNYAQAYSRRKPTTGEAIPLAIGSDNALRADNSLFYVGLWGPQNAPLRNVAISMPTAPTYRMRDVRAVSPDLSLGFSRRMALVTDDSVSDVEVNPLVGLLAHKYDIEPMVWTGDVDLLSGRLLSGDTQFDNIHFESAEAFAAVATHVEARAARDALGGAERSAWSEATLTVRMTADGDDAQHDLADGIWTNGGDMPALWSAGMPDLPLAAGDEAARPLGSRVGVVAQGARGQNLIDSVLAPLKEKSAFVEACFVPVASASDLAADKPDVLVCLVTENWTRPVIEDAVRLGLPVILPASHPLAGHLNRKRERLTLTAVDAQTVGTALERLFLKPDFATETRRANLALAETMAGPERGVGWTRALAAAQKVRQARGGPLRAGRLRTATEIGRTLDERARNDAREELAQLQAECDRLRRDQIRSARIIADLLGLVTKQSVDQGRGSPQ